MSQAIPILELRDVAKSFAGVPVLRGIGFTVLPGEIHALVGENGAGKSTLIKIIGGIHQPSAGRIIYRGQEVSFASPHDAQARGIYIVHQEFSTVPDLSVAENIFLGMEPRNRLGLIDWQQVRRGARALLDDLAIRAHPDALVSDLSVVDRQLLEIAKALWREVSLIVFDEPTAALSQEAAASLLERIKRLRTKGVAIVYISHRLHEVFAIADRITVLKDGALVASQPAGDLDEHKVVNLMVGRELQAIFPGKADRSRGAVALSVRDVAIGRKLRPCSFRLHYGEIVGIAGMAGSGRTTLAHCLFGVLPRASGEVLLDGEPLPPADPRESLRRGMVYLTEDRKVDGLFLEHSVTINVTAATLQKHVWKGLLDARSERQAVRQRIEQLDVRTNSEHGAVVRLSGGNQQKTLLARLLELDPRVLVLDEATRGIDVGTKAEIYRIIDRLAREGAAVLLISSELTEVIGLSDRVLVMREGRIVATLPGEGITERDIMGFAARGGEHARLAVAEA